MSLQSLLAEQVIVYEPEFDAIDAYGNPQPGTEAATTWPARLEQLSSDELVRDRDTVVADWRMFLPSEATVSQFARVESAGRTFDVWGDPIERRSPRGVHHQEIKLRRVT